VELTGRDDKWCPEEDKVRLEAFQRERGIFKKRRGLNNVDDMNEQTFNGRFSSTKKPAPLNEVWMKSEWDS